MNKKIVLPILLCCMSTFYVTQVFGNNEDTDVDVTSKQLYEKAMRCIKDRKYNEAEELLQEIVDDRHSDPVVVAQAFYALAEYIAITRDHDYQKAIKIFDLIYPLKEKAPHVANKSFKRMGDLFARGSLEVPRNVQFAESNYKELIEQKCDLALQAYGYFKLGQLYRACTSEDLFDSTKAFQKFLRASRQNVDPEIKIKSLLILGVMVVTGEGVQKNFDRAVQFFEQALRETKNKRLRAEALIELGSIYSFDNNKDFISYLDVPKGIAYFYAVALQDDDLILKGDALEHLAGVYLLGYREIKADIKKAIEFLDILANSDAGTSDQRDQACIILGDIYRFGKFDMPVDNVKAICYYKKITPPTPLSMTSMVKTRLEWALEQEELSKVGHKL